MPYRSLCGIALIGGGTLTFLLNAGLTPLLDSDLSYAETAVSSIYLWRQGLSALVAILILFGTFGLYLGQGRSGRFGTFAFILAFTGSALLLAHEWSAVFFVRGLALFSPETLDSMDAAEGLSFHNIGAITALVVFTLGWLLFAASLLRSRTYGRRGPLLVIVSFFAIPALTGALGVWGAVFGNAVLGAGWILLGVRLRGVHGGV